MPKPSVVIVGAGATGLMAANVLADKFDVTLLEARERAGGRIQTIFNGSVSQLEAGAEFVHGDLPETFRLLKKAGIKYHKVEGKVYRKKGEALVEQEEFIEHWDALLDKMKSLPNDMVMSDFLETYFSVPKYETLRRHAKAFAEGFDIADINKASTNVLYQEWKKAGHEENYRIEGGYGALIDYLLDEAMQKHCRFITGQLVKQVDWEQHQVKVYTAENHHFYADKLLLTVPVGVLWQHGAIASINFTPPIDEYIGMTREIGYGAVIKVVLQFDQILWLEDAGFFLSDLPFPTWWTQLPDKKPMITGWVGGPKAEALSTRSDEELLSIAMESFSQVAGISLPELKAHLTSSHVFNWQKDPFALGAYSYSYPGTMAARQMLQTPVGDTIYLAGEAYGVDSNGTVEGALLSGKNTARLMLKHLSVDV
jgi:monoamine oxidase